MEFPRWANPELIDLWQQTNDGFNSLLSGKLSPDELEALAKRNAFASWIAMRESVIAKQDCLARLLRHDEAKLAWEWVASGPCGDSLIPRAWRQIDISMSAWKNSPRMTSGEYRNDFSEISKLADKLARKLAVHRGEFPVTALIPDEYRGQIEKSLHPDLIQVFQRKGHAPVMSINAMLPPLHVLIEKVSTVANSINPQRAKPRKIHSESALQIILMNKLAEFLLGNEVRFSTANMARLLSVALDDDSITDDNIRMNARKQDWWEWAKDSKNS